VADITQVYLNPNETNLIKVNGVVRQLLESATGLTSSLSLISTGLIVGKTAVSSTTTTTSGGVLYDKGGTLQFATVTNGVSVSTDGVLGLSFNGATLDNSWGGSNPTNSATSVTMGGLGSSWTITPNYSSRVQVNVTGVIIQSAASVESQVMGYYGTGVAPSAGAGQSGTQFGGQAQLLPSGTNERAPFTISAIITGLTTTTWFDLGLTNVTTGGGTTLVQLHCNAQEF